MKFNEIKGTHELTISETKGTSGVTRLTYRIGRKVVGTARILGITIGSIEVKRKMRHQGYGLIILQDLLSRGGTFAIAGSRVGARLIEKAGGFSMGSNNYIFLSKNAK